MYIATRAGGGGDIPRPRRRVMPLSRKNTKKALPFCICQQNMEKGLTTQQKCGII